ncbi:hypothetical protein ABWH89_09425 [Hoeflea alexandrii]|uniref:hypothetical protein n=1 Tax=Hoeflea alexandrii TaxID=288436 RepID=UPI0035CFCA89
MEMATMCFGNEGTTEIIIQGLSFHEARDFSGELIGLFSDYKVALGAQRDSNIKKIIIKKHVEEGIREEIFSCTFFPSSGDIFESFLTFRNRILYGPHADLKTLFESIDARRLGGPDI